ncbi:helix-turn-helix domain-containing protein [Streptomyces sp. NPDC006678]|uniref:winged helix-turn-helix transcriptional regulator n=1 Tax=Streptomyces sp. NPDC006678 TaxID=3157185 RepID=UPI0033CD2471
MSSDEGQEASTGAARANVLRLSGPCAGWDQRDAEFIREILDLVGDKWSMLVIGAPAAGDARYSDLDTTIPAISRRMLTLTLKRLQRSGLVDRTAYAEVPPRVEFTHRPRRVPALRHRPPGRLVRRASHRGPTPPGHLRHEHHTESLTGAGETSPIRLGRGLMR